MLSMEVAICFYVEEAQREEKRCAFVVWLSGAMLVVRDGYVVEKRREVKQSF